LVLLWKGNRCRGGFRRYGGTPLVKGWPLGWRFGKVSLVWSDLHLGLYLVSQNANLIKGSVRLELNHTSILRIKTSQVPDGDHHPKPLETFPNDPNPDMRSSKVKEVQMVVINLLNNSDSKLASSSSFWSGFVWLVESTTEGVISCTYDPL